MGPIGRATVLSDAVVTYRCGPPLRSPSSDGAGSGGLQYNT